MQEGHENGYAFQQLRQRLQGSNIQVQPEILPLTRLELVLKNKHWCASFIPFSGEDKHYQSFLFSDVPFALSLVRLRQNQPFTWNSLMDLAGLKLAVIRSRDARFVKRMIENGVEIVYTNTSEQSFRMLFRKRIDLVLSDRQSSDYYQAKFGYKNNQLQMSESSVIEVDNGISFNLNCKAARQALSYLKRARESLSKS